MRELARDARDALDLASRVRRTSSIARCRRARALLAEVDAAGELAHDQDVDARQLLGLERRRGRERSVHASPGAGSRTGPAPCECRAGPAPGAPSRSDQSHFGPPTAPSRTASTPCRQRERRGRQRTAGARRSRRRRSARLRTRRSMPESRGHRSSTRTRLRDDFGADAVARQQHDRCALHALRACARRRAIVGVLRQQIAELVDAVAAGSACERIERERATRSPSGSASVALATIDRDLDARVQRAAQRCVVAASTTTARRPFLSALLRKMSANARADARRGSRSRAAPTARARATSRSRSCARRRGSARRAFSGG